MSDEQAIEKARQIARQSSEAATVTQADNVATVMERLAKALPMLLAENYTRERFVRIATTALRATPELSKCSQESIGYALLNCAVLGLEPNTPLGYAYLIPRWSKRSQRMEAHFQIGYQGWLNLIYETGIIKDIQCEEVREQDQFERIGGTDPLIRHIPAPEDRGGVVGVYAVVRTIHGGLFLDYMSTAEIEAVRARGDARSGPWETDWVMMARKTVLKRVCKRLPKTPRLAQAENVDSQPELPTNEVTNEQ